MHKKHLLKLIYENFFFFYIGSNSGNEEKIHLRMEEK